MTVTTSKISLTEYLTYDDGSGSRFELIDGDLVKMALGTGEHNDISDALNECFRDEIKRLGRPWISKMMGIGIQSPRGTRWETSRIPDVVILPSEQWQSMSKRESFIPLNEPSPLLVVEVVSPSTIETDYRAKYAEYAVLDIPEYWIVDPIELKATVCSLRAGFYNDRVFTGEDSIVSPTFPELNLTAVQVLNSGDSR
jgi:Uma2 family endonuclease